ncbi:MAG TPA: UDP-N-acetylmuramate--L-alanine ligase [Micromonosporaceae bacterium]|nr:UDP-N-acetylmuramate--L-alanine ligase [Micromonosporaceae bacterium]
MTGQLDNVHLIGIGGAGMSGVARILLARGARVSGSDARDSHTVLALRAAGASVAIGHRPENLDQTGAAPVVVVSTAIRNDNPELVEATRRGLTVLHRSQALATLMAGRRVACVAGTHGKTSTSSMLTVALQHCGLDPSFAIGGDLTSSGAGAHHGTGDVFVAEADESDGSLLAFRPLVAVVTNVEPDHLDHHRTAEAYALVFDAFAGRIEPGGVLIACADDRGAAGLADRVAATGARVLRYGRAATGDGDARLLGYRPAGHGGLAELRLAGRDLRLRVAVPGEHMALNALAALVAGVELGADTDGLIEGLAGFRGVHRRFEFKGRAGDVRVYDDYAHHPTEVAATLTAAREVAGGGRVLVAFQPHLYSRTRMFATDFGRALALADEVVVLDVYGAREEPEPGVTGELIARKVPLPEGSVHYEPTWAAVPLRLADLARPGDLVLTMGAGDVTVLGGEVVAELDRRTGSAANSVGGAPGDSAGLPGGFAGERG